MALWENAISFEWRTNQRRQTKVPARRRHRGTAGAIAGREAVSYGTPTELLRNSYGTPTDHLPTSWLAPGLCPPCTWLPPGLRMAPVATAFTKSRVLAKLREDVARAQHCSPSVVHCASTESVALADLRGSRSE